jgi:hypothetical protein
MRFVRGVGSLDCIAQDSRASNAKRFQDREALDVRRAQSLAASFRSRRFAAEETFAKAASARCEALRDLPGGKAVMSELFDEREVRRTLEVMVESGSIWEVRAPGALFRGDHRRPGTISGYFDHIEACVSEIKKLVKAKGIYITLNPIHRALLARRANRLDYAELDSTTKDHHVLRRKKLFIDFDSVRPSGVSATDTEKEATFVRAREVSGFLKKRGLPDPILADSGNGCQLVYLIDLPCPDDGLVEKVLDCLGNRFDQDEVEIDRGVHNESRIIKLYGTRACKGDSIPERPWRLSKALDVPRPWQVVAAEHWRKLVEELQPKEKEKTSSDGASASKSTGRDSMPGKEQVREMLSRIPKRPKYEKWYRLVAAVGDGRPLEEAVELLNEWSPEEKEGEYEQKLKSGFREITVGTLFYEAKLYGWTPSPKVTAAKAGSAQGQDVPTAADAVLQRPLSVEPPKRRMDFKEWQAVICNNFPAYARPAEVCASVFAQLLLNDVANPFALALVDVPSSGKTITLNFFCGFDLAYKSDSFSPASFVSHATNVKREELTDIDMLPRIRFRTLIIRDLAPIFGVKEDELLKTIGVLTRALDGEGLRSDSGAHGRRGYEGDYLFMLLAGTTPIPPRVFKVMGTLGSRLFLLALNSKRKTPEQLVAQNRGVSRQEKERICREATDSFLRTLWTNNPGGVDWDKARDPEKCLLVIARCAELLAALRGEIQVWEAGEGLNYKVQIIEQPDRINCLLCNLARGHALLCGRRQLTREDLAPVLEVTFDSPLRIRAKVFRGLLENGGTLTTAQVEKLLRCSTPTALKEMEVLSALGVADKVKVPQESGQPGFELLLAADFEWFKSGECRGLQWKDLETPGVGPVDPPMDQEQTHRVENLNAFKNVTKPKESFKDFHPVGLSDAPEDPKDVPKAPENPETPPVPQKKGKI